MDNKLYICRNCQYVFPKELSELIESEVQVYCEMCGTPFSLSGVSFKKAYVSESREPIHRLTKHGMVDKEKSSLDKAIKVLNKFDYLPIVIYSIFVLIMSFLNVGTPMGILLLINAYLIVFSSMLIIIYDSRFISPRISSGRYDEIPLDAICYGILGCIIYGTGVIMLIKGILIFIYSAKNTERGDHRVYRFGLNLKNSINNFSAKAGFVILLLMFNGVYFSGIEISVVTIFTMIFNQFFLLVILASFILISIIVLIIDLKLKTKIHNKTTFTGADVIRTFILGVLGTIFLYLGIFILLKSILLLLLFVGKPFDINGRREIKEPEKKIVHVRKELPEEPKEVYIKKDEVQLDQSKSISPEPKVQVIEAEKKPLKEETEDVKPTEEEHKEDFVEEVIPLKKEELKKEEVKLRLHESLLPVKNEKDRKIVKEYFSKIFNIISKDIRKQISELDIPKKERKNLLRELAFLAEEEQLYYIEALRNLYEEIPKKLIARIRKLPNVKPKYYDKIVEELKYMDKEQQIEYIQFLEKHA